MKVYVAYAISFLLFLISIILGFSNFKLNLKTMHLTIAILFIFIVLSGTNTHLNRFTTKSPYNYISWIHILIYSGLIFLSIKMLKHWSDIGSNFNKKHEHDKNHTH